MEPRFSVQGLGFGDRVWNCDDDMARVRDQGVEIQWLD